TAPARARRPTGATGRRSECCSRSSGHVHKKLSTTEGTEDAEDQLLQERERARGNRAKPARRSVNASARTVARATEIGSRRPVRSRIAPLPTISCWHQCCPRADPSDAYARQIADRSTCLSDH